MSPASDLNFWRPRRRRFIAEPADIGPVIARAAELATVLAARRRGWAGVVVSAARGTGQATLAEASVDAPPADGATYWS
jgi:hypothetical protein